MKFIHFGCWNNGKCSADETNGLSLTMRKLKSYIEENKKETETETQTEKKNAIEFITIAGDNYYPPKRSSGTKLFIDENFTSGFECLPKDIKKYLIFGNHDIDDIIIDESGNEIKCKILDEQIKIAEENNSIEIFNDVLSLIKSKTLIIMLDTNLYNRKKTNIPINETCYSKLFNGFVNKSNMTIQNLIYYQNCFIKEIINLNLKDINNIIFIGHHPIYSIKNKKDTKDVFKQPNFIDFLKSISDLLIDKKIYYLCADTHIYQKGIVNIMPGLNIEQYVVGTGGADQDKLFSTDNTIIEDGVTVYTKSEEKVDYGFLEIDINDGGLSFKFISANRMSGGGGIKRFKIMKKC
jgi:hypothetical protein